MVTKEHLWAPAKQRRKIEGVPREGHWEPMCGFTLKSVLFTNPWSLKCSFLCSNLAENTEAAGDRTSPRTQVKELKAGQTVLSSEGEQWGHTLKEAIPMLRRKQLQAFCRIYWRREQRPQESTDDDSTPNKSQTTRPRRQHPVQTDTRQKQSAIQDVIMKPEIWAQAQRRPCSKDQSSRVS